MKLKNDPLNYGLVAIILHGSIALLTYGLFGLGLWMVSLGYGDAWSQKAPTLHEGLGVLVFILLLLRTGWGRHCSAPQSLSRHKQWEKTAAYLAKRLLNTLLLVITMSGYLIVTATGDALSVFHLFKIPASLSNLPNQADWAGDIHAVLSWGLILLSGGHIFAALKHHFVDKDSTLKRMLGL